MSQNTKVLRQAAPLRQQVLRLLREEILEGGLVPGERLVENALCDKYEVSRTVIREVLRQLESESLVTNIPNRGPIVTVLTEWDIESLYEVRRSLEGLAGERFAANASDETAAELIAHLHDMETSYLHGTVESRGESKEEFYRLLLRGAGNPILEATLHGIHTRIGLFRRYAFIDEKRVETSMEELRRIVKAAAQLRDEDKARQACEHHIRLAGQLAILEYTKRLHQQPVHETSPSHGFLLSATRQTASTVEGAAIT